MPLTSSVKELEAILQKLINLDKIQNESETNDVGDADELLDEVVGSVQQRKRFGNEMFSQELEMRKESRLNSVKLVKRKIQISYKLEYNNFML